MKFARLYLKAFGTFRDRVIELPIGAGKDFHVIFGPNEAGKSTILRAVTGFLFGIPERTGDAFLHDYNALRVGATLLLADGTRMSAMRRKARKATLFAIEETTGAEITDRPLPDSTAVDLVGGLDLTLYQNLFGLDLKGLVEGSDELLRGEGEVGRSLFQAAAGLASLRTVIADLDEEAAVTFKARGTTGRLNRALSEYDEQRRVLKDATVRAYVWETAEREHRQAELKLAQLREALKDKRAGQQRLQRIRANLPLLAERVAKQEEAEDLLRFARYHAAFSIAADAPPELREPLARLRRLVDVPATLVMRLFECQDVHRTLSIGQFAEALGLIESYVFRRAICGEQTRGYWQVFANLAYRVSSDRPLESLQVGLARLADSYRFPDDDEFRKALEERDVYQKRVCFDLLDRLENHGSKEMSDTSKYSIEHIMPQNEKLPAEWRQMLGEGWQEVQREWLHRLGNLTLTGYNSTYSDRPFDEKKTIAGGFSESSVRLNKYVREQSVWTSREMKARGEELASRALGIWSGLVVDKKLIDEAKEAEMRERAQRRDVGKVPMTATARQLFEVLRERLRTLDSDVIEMAEQRSVSYHGPAFFLEVLPRKNRIGLLLSLDFNEVENKSGIAQDASQWKFIVNALYEGGVYVDVDTEADVDKALPLIHHAREIART